MNDSATRHVIVHWGGPFFLKKKQAFSGEIPIYHPLSDLQTPTNTALNYTKGRPTARGLTSSNQALPVTSAVATPELTGMGTAN